MYKVFDKYNTVVRVEDSDIDAFIASDTEIKREIVQAMGETHKEEYLQYLYPVLSHCQYFMRLDAAHSIFNINGEMGLQELKRREEAIDESELEHEPSEKAMLKAMILRIEGGTESVKKYFLSDEGYEIVKYDTPFCYRSGYGFKEADIDLLCFVLEECQRKTPRWLRKLSKTDYNEMIYFTLESIWSAGEETDLLKNSNSILEKRICDILQALLEQRISNNSKEVIAEITKYMRKESAKKILFLLKDNVKGDAKRAYKQSLKLWGIEEDELQ